MQDLSPTERRIITKLVDAALAREWLISVNDGEEWTVQRSKSRAAIRTAIGTTGETCLMFRGQHDADKPNFASIIYGRVWLVHGNDEDVIADCTDNDDMKALCDAATGERSA